ncbi:MAG: HAMP domain-containing histidine kinase [Bacteroidetes bacterium]|nr:HAMP domain-containing histidine kinase [Bacteroidota bacterium]
MIKSNQGINLGLSMGHELKNTGLNILPYSQVSNLYINKAKEIIYDDKKQYIIDKKSFEYIKENNDYIKSLSEQMLKIVKSFERLMIEYRDSLSNPELCSLKGIVEDTIKQYHFSPAQKEKLHTKLSQDFRIKVPKKVFIFVIDNIIRNAFKHGKPNRIDIWIADNELHIKDDGIGIPQNKVNDIFKMFYSTGDKTSSSIGLAFAKQIVKTFNGEIWCDSQTGEGSYTEFIIKFSAILFDVTDEELKEFIAEESEKKRSKLIAKNMVIEGIDKDIIAKVTKLDIKDINNL